MYNKGRLEFEKVQKDFVDEIYLFGLSVTMPDEEDDDEIDDNRQKLKTHKNGIDNGFK